MTLSPDLILAALAQCPVPPRIYIGYSGGVDSHVLLHLSVSIPELRAKITAVYVHHGLQTQADAWAEHTRQIADELRVGFTLLRVDAQAKTRESPEEAARNARYQALKSLLATDDVLLIAQHREDQLETVLLQLFRGGGLPGLAGMPQRMGFGHGFLIRPLLDIAKTAIDNYAQTHGLHWVEDPSNQSDAYDRNFLRNQILPSLKQRWPMLDKTVARSAKHCGDAQLIITDLAYGLYDEIIAKHDHTIVIDALQNHPEHLQKIILRHWFKQLGIKMPSLAFIDRLMVEVLAAKADAEPKLAGPGYCLRRYRNKLYCLPDQEPEILADLVWPHGLVSLTITDTLGLSLVKSTTGILQDVWQRATVTVRFRSGGEKIRLPQREGRHSLKKLYQDAGIPPWQRQQIPLVYLDDNLAAVGDLWISADFYAKQHDACLSLVVNG